MDIWTKDNIINYTSNSWYFRNERQKYPKELQVARKALREEDKAAKKSGGVVDWNYILKEFT